MLYKEDKNTFEILKAFAHFIVTVLVCIIALLLIREYSGQIITRLTEAQRGAIRLFIELTILVVIFMLINTSYYAFVSYQRIKMLIFSILFLMLGVLRLFAQIVMIYGEKLQFGTAIEQSVSIYTLLGDIVFTLGILISAFFPFEKTIQTAKNKSLRWLPFLLYGILATIFIPFATFLLQRANEIMLITMTRINSALLITAILTNMILFVRNNNGYLIRVCSGLTLMLAGNLMPFIVSNGIEFDFANHKLLHLLGYMVIFFAVFKFNVGQPLQDLKNTEKQVKLYADNLERIVEKRTSEVRKANEKFIHELEYAKSIQQSLLPAKKPVFKDLQFISEYFPCERLSGDFYDIYRIDEDHIGMYVLDVSGHGISAALMTMFCNNVIKSSEKLIKRFRGLKPHRNLLHFYEEFNKMNFPDEMHMVIFYASYNLETGVMTYCSGGLNCFPVLIRENGDVELLEHSKGFPICKMGEFYTPEFVSAHVKLEKNDLVVFYTDGLVDKDKNKCMDDDDLIALLVKHRGASLKTINHHITQCLNSNLQQIDDDVTYFIMKVTRGEKNEGSIDTERVGAD